MKKVLIISYFYPPSIFVGGDRTESWAKHLHESGYYPIIITRCWNQGQFDIVDKVLDNEGRIERNQTHEVHRLPYKYSLRDRCAKYAFLRPLQKALTLWEIFWSNYFICALPYSNFFSYAKRLLREQPDIKIVIASGRPFQSFFIGYRLKKKFDVTWIADYRDDWTTRATNKAAGFIGKLLYRMDQRSEKRWLSNADAFITVNISCKEDIEHYLNDKKGIVIMNGYNPKVNIPEDIAPKRSNILRIAYLGTLYPYQNLDLIVEAVRIISKESPKSIQMVFIGSNTIPSEQKRLEQLRDQSGGMFDIIDRVSKNQLNQLMNDFDLGLLTPYKDLNGCLPVKAFDYYNFRIPMLLSPSDNNAIERFIEETNSGFIATELSELTTLLRDLLEKKRNGIVIKPDFNEAAGEKYSRRYQSKVLGDHLNQLISKNSGIS